MRPVPSSSYLISAAAARVSSPCLGRTPVCPLGLSNIININDDEDDNHLESAMMKVYLCIRPGGKLLSCVVIHPSINSIQKRPPAAADDDGDDDDDDDGALRIVFRRRRRRHLPFSALSQ